MAKKLTIEIPPKQHQALKVAAAERQTSMKDLVIAAVQRHVLKQPKTQPVR